MYAPDPQITHSIIYYAANVLYDMVGIARYMNSLRIHNSVLSLNVVASKIVLPDMSSSVIIY